MALVPAEHVEATAQQRCTIDEALLSDVRPTRRVLVTRTAFGEPVVGVSAGDEARRGRQNYGHRVMHRILSTGPAAPRARDFPNGFPTGAHE